MYVLVNLLLLFVDFSYCRKFTTTSIVPQDLYPCPKDPGTWKSYYSIRKYNRTTTVLNCNMTLDRNFDDTQTISLEIKRWGDGGWKNNFISIQRNKACSSFFFIVPDIAKSILVGANLPPKCPVTKGSYKVENLKASFIAPQLMRAVGQFLFVFKLLDTKTNKVLLCLEGIVTTDD